MAEVIWGLATSHVPSIGAAMDRGKTQDAYWKPLFDGYQPARDWMAQHAPDVALIIYNDHANAFDVDMVPTFAIGTADTYHVADEGFGPRPVPDVAGAPELSQHLVEKASASSHLRQMRFRRRTDLSVSHSIGSHKYPACS